MREIFAPLRVGEVWISESGVESVKRESSIDFSALIMFHFNFSKIKKIG